MIILNFVRMKIKFRAQFRVIDWSRQMEYFLLTFERLHLYLRIDQIQEEILGVLRVETTRIEAMGERDVVMKVGIVDLRMT